MQIVRASKGWGWIASGFALFRAQPIVWIALVFAYWSIMSIVSLLPYVGFAASLLLVPLFSVSFMHVAHTAESGRRPEFQMLFSGFRERQKPLVVLGVVYLMLHLALFAALLVVAPTGEGGADLRRLGEGDVLDPSRLESVLLRAALVATVLYLPIVAAFWFAPVLVAWDRLAPAKALFFSFFAVVSNWRAFLVYGIAVTLLAGVLLGFVVAVFSAFAGGRGAAGPGVLRIAMPVYVATLMPILFASFYASYRSVFPPPEESAKPLLEQGHPDA